MKPVLNAGLPLFSSASTSAAQPYSERCGRGRWIMITSSVRMLHKQRYACVKVTVACYIHQCEYSDAFWELMDFTFHISTSVLGSFVAVR